MSRPPVQDRERDAASVNTSIDSQMPTAQQRLAWPCVLSPEAPRQAHSAYLRAVVSALGPHAGSVEWDDSLAGTGPDGEEIILLEAFIDVAGAWTLKWTQTEGWSYSIAPMDEDDDEPKERLPLITGAIVPPPETVVRAALLLANQGTSALPYEGGETLADAEVGPEQRDFLGLEYVTPDTARRLATYSRAENSVAPDLRDGQA